MDKKNSIIDIKNSVLKNIRIAVCGNLPTACNCLLKCGVVNIDNFSDAAEIPDETLYHLILIYAPQAEGLLNTRYSRSLSCGEDADSIPIRLLNEPACSSALVELRSKIRRIAENMKCETETRQK